MDISRARLIGRTSRIICDKTKCFAKDAGGGVSQCDHPDKTCAWKEQMRLKTLAKMGIYERYADCNFAMIEEIGVPEQIRKQYAEIKMFANNLEYHVKKGEGLILRGPVGTMKTTLAIAILQHYGYGYVIRMPVLLDKILTLKDKPAEREEFENHIKNTPILVIDDLGAEQTESWILTKVEAIICERYDRCKSMIITTNLDNEKLRATYAERILDRLNSVSKIINFAGASLRKRGG